VIVAAHTTAVDFVAVSIFAASIAPDDELTRCLIARHAALQRRLIVAIGLDRSRQLSGNEKKEDCKHGHAEPSSSHDVSPLAVILHPSGFARLAAWRHGNSTRKWTRAASTPPAARAGREIRLVRDVQSADGESEENEHPHALRSAAMTNSPPRDHACGKNECASVRDGEPHCVDVRREINVEVQMRLPDVRAVTADQPLN
jgi:hypothetical protein